MGKIQQQLKQDLNVAGALYTQTASYQQKQAEKEVEYKQKSLEKQRENIEQSSIEPKTKQKLLDENLIAQIQAGKNPINPASPERIEELRKLKKERDIRLESERFEQYLKDEAEYNAEIQDYWEEQDREEAAKAEAEMLKEGLYGDVKDDKKADMSQKVASVSEKSQNSQRSRVQDKLKNLKSTGSREPKKNIKFTRI